METQNIPPHRLQKERARLEEDAALELKLEGLNLTVTSADPITKTVGCKGPYADFLLGRKIAAKKGWNIELN